MNQASLPYDNIEELAVLLQASFSGNNETIKQSQTVFGQMSQDPIRFLDSLMKIITSEKDGIKHNIQTFYLLTLLYRCQYS